MPPYTSLFKRYKDQDPRTAFAFFRFNLSAGENWETHLERLSQMAKIEEWDFKRPEIKSGYTNQKYPILANYLNYTFLRAQELNSIAYNDSNDRACFNTGLQTPMEHDIYITFFRNKKAEDFGASDWTFYDYSDSYSEKVNCFRPLPCPCTYISKSSDLIFDISLDLEVNYEHILRDNLARFPAELQSNTHLALRTLRGSIESMKDRIIRNYKIAIPHWYENKIQLLLPINLVSPNNMADLALVVDKDETSKVYKARTVLPMDYAYMNARLLAQPDRDWLNP